MPLWLVALVLRAGERLRDPRVPIDERRAIARRLHGFGASWASLARAGGWRSTEPVRRLALGPAWRSARPQQVRIARRRIARSTLIAAAAADLRASLDARLAAARARAAADTHPTASKGRAA